MTRLAKVAIAARKAKAAREDEMAKVANFVGVVKNAVFAKLASVAVMVRLARAAQNGRKSLIDQMARLVGEAKRNKAVKMNAKAKQAENRKWPEWPKRMNGHIRRKDQPDLKMT